MSPVVLFVLKKVPQPYQIFESSFYTRIYFYHLNILSSNVVGFYLWNQSSIHVGNWFGKITICNSSINGLLFFWKDGEGYHFKKNLVTG